MRIRTRTSRSLRKTGWTDLGADPSIQGFLRHFADSASSVTSSHGETAAHHTPPIELVPPSGHTSGGQTMGHGHSIEHTSAPRPFIPPAESEPSGSQRLMSFGVGFIIAVGGGILVYLLLGGAAPNEGLSQAQKARYMEASQAGNYGEAWAVVKEADKETKLSPQTKEQLLKQLKNQALAPFSGHLERGDHGKAAALIRQALYDEIITKTESQELYERSLDALMTKYEQLVQPRSERGGQDPCWRALTTARSIPRRCGGSLKRV